MKASTQGTQKKLILTEEIAAVSDEINVILNSKQKDRYFEGIAIVHSFIEDMLKWLVFTQIVWNRSRDNHSMMTGEVEKIREYCNGLNFYSLLNLGLSTGLITFDFFNELNKVRNERNSLVHQYWVYIHKGKRLIFRKKLEKLAGIGSKLVSCLNRLVDEIGWIDDSFFEVSRGRNFVIL